MADRTTPQRRGTTSARILAPDVARGLALLGIAAANIPTAWAGYEHVTGDLTLGGIRPGATGFQLLLDQLAMVFGAIFVHVRGLPMFTALVGFGIGLISLSLQKRDFPRKAAKRVLWRRYGFLALFGLIHCVFLFYGDIMLLYGLMALIVIAMIGFSNKTLIRITTVLFSIGAVMGLVLAWTSEAGYFDAEMGGTFRPETYLGQLGLGGLIAVTSVFSLIPASFNLLPVMLVGFIFARSGVLHRPLEHLRTLYAWIAAGAAVVLFVGLPWGLSSIGVLNPEWAGIFQALNGSLGYFTGPAIVALVAVALIPAQQKYEDSGAVPTWLLPAVALGKRSMSGYLFQSIVLFILMLPYTLNLWVDVGAFRLQLIALGVWLVSLAIATVMEKTDTPGPFEWAHRRVSYGKQGLPQHYSEAITRARQSEYGLGSGNDQND